MIVSKETDPTRESVKRVVFGHPDVPGVSQFGIRPSGNGCDPAYVNWDGEAFAVHVVEQEILAEPVRLARRYGVVTAHAGGAGVERVGGVPGVPHRSGERAEFCPRWATAERRGRRWRAPRCTDKMEPSTLQSYDVGVTGDESRALTAWHFGGTETTTFVQLVEGTVPAGAAHPFVDELPWTTRKALSRYRDGWMMALQTRGIGVEAHRLDASGAPRAAGR